MRELKEFVELKIVKMIKRPKNTDTEHDILKMQNEFLTEKEKNREFQPAAKVVRLDGEIPTGGCL